MNERNMAEIETLKQLDSGIPTSMVADAVPLRTDYHGGDIHSSCPRRKKGYKQSKYPQSPHEAQIFPLSQVRLISGTYSYVPLQGKRDMYQFGAFVLRRGNTDSLVGMVMYSDLKKNLKKFRSVHVLPLSGPSGPFALRERAYIRMKLTEHGFDNLSHLLELEDENISFYEENIRRPFDVKRLTDINGSTLDFTEEYLDILSARDKK